MKIEKKPSNSGTAKAADPFGQKSPLFWATLLLLGLLAVIFWRCFIPSYVLFSNDGPYGAMVQEYNRMPSIIHGVWANMTWFGNESVSPPPSVSSLMRILTTPLTPLIYAKILPPVSLLIAGIGACFCFRKLRLAPLACILGGIAAALNSDFFSTACWGVATQVIGFGFMYIAVGLIVDPSVKRQWVRAILAGLAVGVGVMEAYDIGALFSLFIAAFVVYHAFFLSERPASTAQKGAQGIIKVGLVGGFALFIAAHSLLSLVNTQIQGISGAQQDEATRQARWDEATQWSLPKAETLQVFIPGVFGFRDSWYMYEYDEPTNDQYWGTIGNGGGLNHLIGTGFYAGVPVVVIALWAVLQALRRQGSPFTIFQRRAIWFWLGTTIVSVLMSYGKHAPFYRFFYALPYASTIRNPDKFMHVASWALVILFAYGVHGLVTVYLENYVARVGGFFGQFKTWLAKASSFERKWWYGSFIAIGLSLVGWLMYASMGSKLMAYVQTVGVPATDARGVVNFSFQAVAWFVLFLVVTVVLLTLIFSGQFSGSRARWAGLLLGALMVFDLGRADVPWIVYWDLDYKYAPDPIIQILADKPYEHRIALLPRPPDNPDQETAQQFALLVNAYNSDWKQHLFPFFNIQCAEVVQEPRMPLDKQMYLSYFPPNNPVRFWQFSNCRYMLGATDLIRQLDPQQRMFRVLKTFNFVPKRDNPSTWPADWRTELNPNGKLALIEFLGALPRAKLYSHWQVNTNDQAILQTIANPAFDLFHDVVVANDIPAPSTTNADPGTVEINPNYKSKRIEMQADVKVPSVLLFSERYNPKWQVEVDGKPGPLLRCDFIERGVYLTPGKHDVVMRFAPPITTLWISLAAIAVGLGLWGFLIFSPAEPEELAEEKKDTQAKEKAAAK
ncbi:MAG TPA: hypothetical protein VG754_06455 [Verrucomicrobiae bacterium]|nr:hypothetical protein [Verrucomicrobiae bacterium]